MMRKKREEEKETEEEDEGRKNSASACVLTLEIIGFKQKDVTVVKSEAECNPRGAGREGVTWVL
jgi:Holliday junction resolvasome RuvABC DNA-binding subunit